MQRLFIGLIHFYQKYISLHLPRSCIYHPSCSLYTIEMLKKHGVLKGIIGGMLRILRCQGLFFSGGHDPIPRSFSWKRILGRYLYFWRWRR